MESYTIVYVAIFAIMVSATATPIPPHWRVPHWQQRPIKYQPFAQSRSSNVEAFADDRMSLGGLGLGSLGWSQKMPFDLISGPYQSSLGQGYEAPGGYGGLSFGGLPLISGPLSGVMGLPLMMLMAG
ncbi:unnamed protein product [Orchesella dallaii]|uniref:Uncharacterized protein n=1 Tax=Orchesella dallaii TaxID=48710 RepID=A0ABP1QBP2_9HEXA